MGSALPAEMEVLDMPNSAYARILNAVLRARQITSDLRYILGCAEAHSCGWASAHG
jgi:hypothetical protein